MDDPAPSTCSNCGTVLTPADNFCPDCGRQIHLSEDHDATETHEDAVPGPSQESSGSESASRSDGFSTVTESGEPAPPRVQTETSQLGETAESTPGVPGSRRGEESQLRTVGIAIAIGVLGMVLLVLGTVAAALLLYPFGIAEPIFLVVGTSVGQLIGFGGLGLWYLRRRGYDWSAIRSYLGVRIPSLREIGVVVGGYVGIIVALIVISVVVTLFLPEPAENQGAQAAAENPEIIPAMILMMLFVVGPCEELLYRGVVQNRLRENLDVLPSIAIASFIFAAVHVVALAGDVVGILVTILILFFPAMIFGWVYEYTGNLVVPALLHGIHNSILLTLLFFAPELEEAEAIVGVFELALLVLGLR